MKKLYTLLSLVVLSFAVNAQCTDLFFSEYVEGTSNNKALEIYNPTSSAIDLSNYAVIRMNNGKTTSPDTFRMNGMLASEAVYIIANSQADAAILALADTTGSATFYNGDDALTLANITLSTVVDLFGVPGVDPGSAWTWVSGATNNSTLVRNYSVQSGVATWDTLEWVSSTIDDFSNLGSHSSACYPPKATEPAAAVDNPTQEAVDVISIYSQSYTDPATVNYYPGWGQTTQYADFVIGTDSMIKYSSLNYQGIDFDASQIDASSMEMLHIDIWTADVDDIEIFPISRASGEKAVKRTLTAGQWNSFDIPLSEYTSQGLSMSDIFQFKFDNTGASRGTGTIFIDNMYLWKEPTLVYTAADIADIIMLDADLAPTNEGTLYEITGVVYGVDLDGNAGLSFTIIDETAGMNIFNFNDVDDYVVTEGDEITVKGKIDFFNGLLELFADSIKVNSQNNTLKAPTLVSAPSEATESDFITLEKVWVTNDTITVWPNNGNVELTNEDMDTFQIRIDRDIPGIVGMPVEFDTMTITGIGGQFDNRAPYNEGYQIFPRGLSDIAEWVDLSSVREIAVQTSVYPNPANNNLTVAGATKWDNFVVYSIMGSEVSAGTLNNNNLSVSNLENGTYIIKLVAGEQVGVARFVVNK
ncbi:MAG TPA: hypothetical protein DCY51_02750 [Bacteroidetes bacterium]|nr:hypothetical protein [Bacteroidota bacterium]